MNDLPLLSVIVPVYNVEAYLNQCIASITGQTYPNLEILLVDDGSTDASGSICDDWAKRDGRIRVFHPHNGGAGAARNLALDQSRGELLALVDSDDYLQPDMYRTLYRLMDGETDVAECGIAMAQDDHCLLEDGSGGEVSHHTPQQAMALHIRDEAYCQTPVNKLYRRETVAGWRFPVGKLIDDEFWTYRVLGTARALVRTTSKMYAYRQQPGSVMHKRFSLARLQGVAAKEQRLDYLKAHMPTLVPVAKRDLFFTCLYGMQGSLDSLSPEDQEVARTLLNNAVRQLRPLAPGRELSPGKNALLMAGQLSLEGTAKFLNRLIRLGVLT